MPLTIKALSYKGNPLSHTVGERLAAVFDRGEGTLGRASGNHFILPDPEKVVSGQHAVISYANGCYYLEDISSNGTFIYNRNLNVHKERVQLNDGDKLRVGDYDLVISITAEIRSDGDDSSIFFPERGNWETSGPSGIKPFAPDEVPLWPGDDPPSVVDHPVYPSELPADFFDKLFGPTDDRPSGSTEQDAVDGLEDQIPPQDADPPVVADHPVHPSELPPDFFDRLFNGDNDAGELRTDPESKEVITPHTKSTSQEVPENLPQAPNIIENPDSAYTNREEPQAKASRFTGQLAGQPAPADPQTTPQRRERAYGELFKSFLQAAGMQDTSFFREEDVPELMRTVGTLFREMLEGLVAVLRERTELKVELRALVTTLKAVHNNPLKFSPIIEEILKLLLAKSHPGFIDGVDAVREAYADIKIHQAAMTAGFGLAVAKLLERFDPQHIAQQYEGGMLLQRKTKCWDAYCQAYPQIVKGVKEDLFGEAFVRAYEEQSWKLRSGNNESRGAQREPEHG
jgi:type VI secretion system protein